MVCKKCGYNLDDDSVFCKKCGTPVAEEKVPVETVKKKEKYEKLTPKEVEERKSKWAWLLYLIITVIVLVFAIIAFIINKCGGNSKINYENYKKIQTGMSYEQIYDFLGGCDERSKEGHQHQICTWSENDNDDVKIIIEFTNNKATKISQTGLET